MGRPLRELTPYVSARHRFGAELRRLRRQCGMSQAELGLWVMHSGSTVSKVEKAERWPSREFAHRSDEVLCAGGVLVELWMRVQEERSSEESSPGGRGPESESKSEGESRSKSESKGEGERKVEDGDGGRGAQEFALLGEILTVPDRQRRCDLLRLAGRIAADLRDLRAIVAEHHDAARLRKRVEQVIHLLSEGAGPSDTGVAPHGGPVAGDPADRAFPPQRWRSAHSHRRTRPVLDRGGER
ncbi:helix-turn-helix transcriptional regulator [Streptomyces cyaneofuscatus]|uniref:helix-turn-helix transcriptional regulator n=1 Tax=Streptomyces cyaneofuscatus TaxID=66883 RepID=UPI0036536AF9